jgi:hypothetical protein
MKARFYAFLAHLLLSGLVAALAIIMVFFVWYPMPLHEAVGVTEIFLMLLAVDIVIGPVMTFIVYRRGKPSLKFDLSVIAAFQLAALSYGMHTVFEGRPAFVVFSQDRFEIARPIDIDADSAKKARLEGNQAAKVSWGRPKWVGATGSSDPKRRQEILFSSVQGGPDWPQLPELYVSLTTLKEQILKTARPLADLRTLRSQNKAIETLMDWQDTSVKWLPLRGRIKDMAVLVDAHSAEVIKVVDINPWP